MIPFLCFLLHYNACTPKKHVQSAMIEYFSSVTDNIVTTYTIILWLVKRHYKSIADNVNDVLPCHIRNFIHHNTLIH